MVAKKKKDKNLESLNMVNDYLEKRCETKVNKLMPGDKKESDCPCSPSDGKSKGKVDLVILIDSSTTMPSKATMVNQAAPKALETAKKQCGVDVRDTWLWVDSTKTGSSSAHGLGTSAGNFTQSHQKYLESIGATGPFYHDSEDTGYPREQGADAIADISEFFDWRENSCRSIFYISDTKLEGYKTHAADSDSAVSRAINVASQNNVTVFAHRCDKPTFLGTMSIAEVDEDYANLCNGTGGYAETGGKPSTSLYEQLITTSVCDCGGGCTEIEIPTIKPCISISWGDSKCDCLETDDFEVLCITACNCYSNVELSNFVIGQIEITDSKGKQVASLPDGTPSVQAVPIGPICFGSIPPCKDGEAGCVSREFVINTRGAKEGDYKVNLYRICYDVNFKYKDESSFKFKLCKD